VLKLRVENPQWRSAELAEALGHQVAETITAERLRVTLHRARERFSNFLIDAVTETLQSASLEDVEEELADLELLQYCQSAIEKRRQ
jgi:thiamine pyrophosphate-dependent acetolactate synthase large subunit-like protein